MYSIPKLRPSKSQYVLQHPFSHEGKREQSESDEVSFEKLREYFRNFTNFLNCTRVYLNGRLMHNSCESTLRDSFQACLSVVFLEKTQMKRFNQPKSCRLGLYN